MDQQDEKKLHTANLFSMLAELYKDPDMEFWNDFCNNKLLDQIKEELSLYGETAQWEVTDIPTEFSSLKKMYADSLGSQGVAIPVESLYKQWTADPSCTLPFAKSKGYLLGDPAMHVKFILNEFEMEIPEEYKSTPDHLAVLLELLSYFILHAPDEFTFHFMDDHFDWLEEFLLRLAETNSSPFYYQMTKMLERLLEAVRKEYIIMA
ncbi:molecular chaperone [Mesobacillus zeae]|uniref:Molecular chaperone TorD n=1 Tax=Mesobacillus zeae TaxID=1917180 RepID=A0A398BE62_9BACI|nr:molecular chaperone TorD family protein [Mesobacillus zeae]RID88077.1 hypothetical protein D1970_04385 [Mesobacillus zeae]